MYMKIIKRTGKSEEVKFDKISSRIKKQCYDLDRSFVDPFQVATKVISGIYDGITSKELDTLATETAASLSGTHPDYSALAARLAITSLYKETPKLFSNVIEILYNYIDSETNEPAGLISKEVYDFIQINKDVLDSAIIMDRDFLIDYFGFKTLERSYLLKINNQIIETPQFMWMRVACGIWFNDLSECLKTYDLLSTKYFTHATPTLFNAGTQRPQLSSCFLLDMQDSMTGIYKTLSDTAQISKYSGGIGINASKIRASGSYIKGTSGKSDGIIPMIRVFNETARYVNQGGKRKGSFAIYIEPWHADIFEFLDLRKNTGKEENRARDIFTALWMNDLFMQRLQNDENWSLFCPNEAPRLTETYGEEFNNYYLEYESSGKARKTIPARELWTKILESQIETGTPYILYKDSINEKSNQKNIDIIRSSNLCAEIVEVSNEDEIAVCNLASIALPSFIEKGKFNFVKLKEIAYQACKNLNRVIDINFYPTPETKFSNLKNRPIAIGVQGLADVFAILKMSIESQKAKDLNKKIFETIYYGALECSTDLAKITGSYQKYQGSPLSQGLFQFNLWTDNEVESVKNKMSVTNMSEIKHSGLWDWDALKEKIMTNGVVNSLVTALMPTASTSQIFGFNECFEPFTSNLYKRSTLSGEFIVINKYLVQDLIKLGLWSENMKLQIISNDGSIQSIFEIPLEIKELYKTVWEIKQRSLIDLAADRSPYIDQTQSMNLFFENINFAKLTSAHIYGWLKGLKTGIYYTRTRSVASALKGLGIDQSKIKISVEEEIEGITCSLDNPEACEACGA